MIGEDFTFEGTRKEYDDIKSQMLDDDTYLEFRDRLFTAKNLLSVGLIEMNDDDDN